MQFRIFKYLSGVLLLTLSGCGFTFQGSGSVLPADVKRIAIPLAENDSAEAGLSQIVTESLRDRFERFGVITVVDNIHEADAVLRTRITSVNRSTNTVSSVNDTAVQLTTTLNLASELRRVSGPVLWRNAKISVAKPFGTSQGVVVTSSAAFAEGTLGSSDLSNLSEREVSRSQEREALRDVAEEAARKIYDEAVSPDF